MVLDVASGRHFAGKLGDVERFDFVLFVFGEFFAHSYLVGGDVLVKEGEDCFEDFSVAGVVEGGLVLKINITLGIAILSMSIAPNTGSLQLGGWVWVLLVDLSLIRLWGMGLPSHWTLL